MSLVRADFAFSENALPSVPMTMSRDDTDARFMRAALAIARRGLGLTAPNPTVGCVIVKADGAGGPIIVGRGWTGEGGRPHGETIALYQAGNAARGATAYVTLEPCSHHGKTPPCTDALIAAGIARVVSALEDPDPRVAGKGHAALASAGIAVETGCLAAEAADLNAGHITRQALGRPHVTLKLALSRDGMIAARPGASTPITGPLSQARVHMMRAMSDAVMVGSGTWKADDPQLTCRLAGLEDRSPVRIVLDARAELPPTSTLAGGANQVPLWVAVDQAHAAGGAAALRAVGAEFLDIPAGDNGRLDIAAVLQALGSRGITRLIVEGGARLAASLIDADLVDEVALFVAPGEIGSGGVVGLSPDARARIEDGAAFKLVSRDTLGPDTLSTYKRTR